LKQVYGLELATGLAIVMIDLWLIYAIKLRILSPGRRRGTCDGKSSIHPHNLWVRGPNFTGGSQPAKLPSFGGYSLETLPFP